MLEATVYQRITSYQQENRAGNDDYQLPAGPDLLVFWAVLTVKIGYYQVTTLLGNRVSV